MCNFLLCTTACAPAPSCDAVNWRKGEKSFSTRFTNKVPLTSYALCDTQKWFIIKFDGNLPASVRANGRTRQCTRKHLGRLTRPKRLHVFHTIHGICIWPRSICWNRSVLLAKVLLFINICATLERGSAACGSRAFIMHHCINHLCVCLCRRPTSSPTPFPFRTTQIFLLSMERRCCCYRCCQHRWYS